MVIIKKISQQRINEAVENWAEVVNQLSKITINAKNNKVWSILDKYLVNAEKKLENYKKLTTWITDN